MSSTPKATSKTHELRVYIAPRVFTALQELSPEGKVPVTPTEYTNPTATTVEGPS